MSQASVLICLPGPRRPLHVGSRVCKPQQHQSLSSSAPVVLACRVPWAVPARVTVLQLGGPCTAHLHPLLLLAPASAKCCCDCKV